MNEGTINNLYRLLLIRETLMQLSKNCHYTNLNVRSAYNLLRIAQGEDWKTLFRNCYGLYKCLVMPLGITNTPTDFQRFFNNVLYHFLNNFCTAYLDDIFIYSNVLQEQYTHVKTILLGLCKASLQVRPENASFI